MVCLPRGASTAVDWYMPMVVNWPWHLLAQHTTDLLAFDVFAGPAFAPWCSPLDSYSWIPGSTACLRCVSGVPRCVRGGSDSECPNTGTSSPGNHIVGLNAASTCANTNKPAWYGKCAMTAAATKFSLRVAGDCSIDIIPIADPACAEEGSSYFDSQHVTAYYRTATTISSLLPATNATTGVT